MRVEVDALRGDVSRLQATVATLTANAPHSTVWSRRGPRDAADVELLAVLARRIGSRAFSSVELRTHRREDPELADALDNAVLETAKEIGCYCRRMRNVTIDGRTLRRDGRRWYVHVDHVDMHEGRPR